MLSGFEIGCVRKKSIDEPWSGVDSFGPAGFLHDTHGAEIVGSIHK